MSKIQINIVGIISNGEELKEIENIAKLFVIEERLIDLTYSNQPPRSNKKTDISLKEQIKIAKNSIFYNYKSNSVKGLN